MPEERHSQKANITSVEVWVKNSEGQFLVTKRHPDKKAGNLWEFTGGGTLAGEKTWKSAIRELQEDTGIDAVR